MYIYIKHPPKKEKAEALATARHARKRGREFGCVRQLTIFPVGKINIYYIFCIDYQ